MLRLFSILVVVATLNACSRTPAETAAATSAASAPQATATAVSQQPATPPKPVPAQLPELVARVNGEAVTKGEFERALEAVEARAGGPVPPEQRDRVYRGVLDQLVGYKLLAQESKTRKVAVSDAEIKAQLDKVRGQFPSEDVFKQMLTQRNVTIASLSADARQDLAISKMIDSELSGKLTVTDREIEDFYAKNPEQFKEPERVRASHILIGTPQGADAAAKAKARATAEQVLKDVRAGKDFAALAKQYSQDPGSAHNGGDLGYFQQGQMVGPFNDVAFSLKPGQVSDLVETQFGFHIIKAVDRQPGRTVPLTEVRDKVQQHLENINRQKHTQAFVESLRAKGKIEMLI